MCQTYPTQHRAKFDIGPGLYEAEFHVRTRDAVSRLELDKVTKPYVRGMRCIDSTARFLDLQSSLADSLARVGAIHLVGSVPVWYDDAG